MAKNLDALTETAVAHTLSASWPALALAAALVAAAAVVITRAPRTTARAARNLAAYGALVAPKRFELRRRANHARIAAAARISHLEIRRIRPAQNPGRFFQYVRSVNPYVFEELVLRELRRRKLNVVKRLRYSADRGVDGEFRVAGVRYLVQAKRYVDYISPDHVYDFDVVCQQQDAFGLFVHTGKTSESAAAKVRQSRRVSIMSGQALVDFFSGRGLKLQPGGRARAVG